jgi:hypothetical protein
MTIAVVLCNTCAVLFRYDGGDDVDGMELRLWNAVTNGSTVDPYAI